MREGANGDIALPLGSDLATNLTDSVQMAAEQVAARPLTSYRALNNDLSNDHALINSYQEDIHSSIRTRLSEDPDFKPDDFPHADEFFASEKK